MNTTIKFLITICIFFASFITAKSQSNSFNYQAVVRDAAGNILANRTIGFRFRLTSVNQTFTYFLESQTLTTNNYGVVNAVIGSVNTSGINAIEWNTPFIYHVEIDPNGGTNYTLTNSNTFKSVPYALYSKISKTTEAISGQANYIPKFETSSKLTNSILYEDNNNVGIGTATPSAALDINTFNSNVLNCTSSSNYTKVNLKSTLKSLINFYKDNTINYSIVSDGTPVSSSRLNNRLDFFGSGSTDTLLSFEKYTGFSSFYLMKTKAALITDNTIQIGKNGTIINSLYHGRTQIGSSNTQKKIITISLPETQLNTNYKVLTTLEQQNAISDIFSISVTNKTTQSFQVVVYRIDATTGWGQNPNLVWSVINQ